MAQTGYNLSTALRILYDKGLVDETNMKRVSKEIPMESSGYIQAKDLEKFDKKLGK